MTSLGYLLVLGFLCFTMADVVKDPKCALSNDEFATFLPHETDCESFYICDNGYKILMKCPTGLLWNLETCDWPFTTSCLVTEETEYGGEDGETEDGGESAEDSKSSESSESSEIEEVIEEYQ